jgi:hypothetical protein
LARRQRANDLKMPLPWRAARRKALVRFDSTMNGDPMKHVLPVVALALVVVACNKTDKSEKTALPGTAPHIATAPAERPAPAAAPTAAQSVEQPNPTAAQAAALANGQTAKWDQQGITWTLPANWKKADVSKDTFVYGGDGAFLTVAVSTMDPGFPTDVSLNAMYEAAKANEKTGKYDESKWLTLDGVRGFQCREAKPAKADDIRRLQWQGYRKYSGQTQLVTIVLSTNGAAFPKHQDKLTAILGATKLAH